MVKHPPETPVSGGEPSNRASSSVSDLETVPKADTGSPAETGSPVETGSAAETVPKGETGSSHDTVSPVEPGSGEETGLTAKTAKKANPKQKNTNKPQPANTSLSLDKEKGKPY